MLAIEARIMKPETELLLKSRYVVPSRLLHAGFTFDFPIWADAAHDLCQKWRQQQHSHS